MSGIHPTAIVEDGATLGEGVDIGPWAVVENGAVIGDETRLLARAYVCAGTVLGRRNIVHMNAVIGHVPQARSFDTGVATGLVIGDDNELREGCTIHRSITPDSPTRVGSRCVIMVNGHIAHDAQVGDDVVICNGALIAGHVEVGDRVFVSGNVSVHQFTRIGAGCMLGGRSGLGQDAPPYTTIVGRSEVRSLNFVGMRRAGVSPEGRNAVKAAYRSVFAGRDVEHARAVLDRAPDTPEIEVMRAFYATESKRGFAWPPRDSAVEREVRQKR